MINILCTAFWVPFRATHTIRCVQLHELFVLTLDWKQWMIDSVVNLVEEHVDLGVSKSRTLELCWWFTTECGSPGILKSMSSSILSWVNPLSVLSVVISRCTSGASCRSTLRFSSCPVRSWVCSTRNSSDRFFWALITLRVISDCPDRSEEQSSSRKKFSSISWERDVSPFTLNTSCVSSGCPDRSQIGFGICWVGWENVEVALFHMKKSDFFVKRINSDLLRKRRVSFILQVNSRPDLSRIGFGFCWVIGKKWVVERLHLLIIEQLSNQILLSIRDIVRSLEEVQGDMYAFSKRTSPIFNLSTFKTQ